MSSITEPVHEHIIISKLEKALLNSPFLQRLQWIGQLTGTKHVFPGGVHTRFIHSAGAMHLAGLQMSHLFTTLPTFDEKDIIKVFGKSKQYFIQLARIAALTHDIGHGPFSHSFDKTVYKPIYNVPDNGHDFHRFKLIESDLLKPYIEACGITTEDVAKVWNSTKKDLEKHETAMYHIIHCVVQGPLGADRMDFTKRDAYFTGSKQFGNIADKRILYQSSIKLVNGVYCLCYNTRCISNIIQALDGRKYMYNNVYYHQISMSSSLLIERMMEECAVELKLCERVQNPKQFHYINDTTLMGEILALPETHISNVYCKRFLDRDLPKLVKEISHLAPNEVIPDDKTLPKNTIMIKTKMLTGINPKKFDDYHIYFDTCNDDGTIHICSASELLNNMHYIPQTPYQIVRWYLI
jgi:HD superfamily phosphohydrolase